MKKNNTIILLLTIIFMLSFTINVSATDTLSDSGYSSADKVDATLPPVEEPDQETLKRAVTNTYDEYEMYNALRSKSEEELRDIQYSDEEIAFIKENSYESLLRERGKLPADELKNMGYTDKEIAILQDPNSTDKEIIKASATLSITTVVEKLDYHTNGWTYSTVYTQWIWSSKPSYVLRDDSAISWSGQMAFMDYNENNKSRYTLYTRNLTTGNTNMTTNGLTDNDNTILGAAVQIPSFKLLTISWPSGTYLFCYKGAARVALKYYGRLSWMQSQGAYAHYVDSVSGISISIPAGISLEFSLSPYTTYRANDDLVVNDL